MSGIQEAENLVELGRCSGEVVKKGFFTENNGTKTNYLIIFLDDDTEIIQRDYGGDLKISPNLDMGDRCKLVLHDSYTAEWVRE